MSEPAPLDEMTKQHLAYLLDLYKVYLGHINTMFNYFLILSGLFVNAYITALSKPEAVDNIIPLAISFLGACLSTIAYLIHIRSRDMVDTIEEGLLHIERKMFTAGTGFLNARITERPFYHRHKYQFRVIYLAFIFAFIGMFVYAAYFVK